VLVRLWRGTLWSTKHARFCRITRIPAFSPFLPFHCCFRAGDPAKGAYVSWRHLRFSLRRVSTLDSGVLPFVSDSPLTLSPSSNLRFSAWRDSLRGAPCVPVPFLPTQPIVPAGPWARRSAPPREACAASASGAGLAWSGGTRHYSLVETKERRRRKRTRDETPPASPLVRTPPISIGTRRMKSPTIYMGISLASCVNECAKVAKLPLCGVYRACQTQ
jgi:hypothetical protein